RSPPQRSSPPWPILRILFAVDQRAGNSHHGSLRIASFRPLAAIPAGGRVSTMVDQARILVVDDEPAVQNALSRALALERYEVQQASDGRDALERLGAAPFEVVILDIAMPQVDGLEVCRRLRDAGDRTPVLMLTARDQVDDRVAGLDAGADDYLVK